MSRPAPIPEALSRRINGLWRQADQALLADQHRLRSRLRRLREDLAQRRLEGEAARQALDRIAEGVARSAAHCAQRRAELPRPAFPAALPVAARKDDIAAAIREHQVVVVCGETGSGKTTQLPKICLELGRGAAGLIGHTQPRRIAARSVAARIAEELGSPLGRHVGFKVRFTDTVGPDACIKVMTDGILLAETQADRFLAHYDTLIIDEAHERSLNIDFLLGYLRQILPRRPDLKLIITSATIDPQRFSRHFLDAPVIEVSGRMYPVEVRYRPLQAGEQEDDPRDPNLPRAIVAAVRELAGLGPGDVLVFLSGEREIREAAEALRQADLRQTEILPLYARLSAAEQMRVFQPHAGRRIVLATNVAETSLTVPGIRYVVDPGLARVSRYNPRMKVERLPIEPVSRASAQQRAGRCGRLADGVCIRLYSEEDFQAREAFTQPEILRSNLAGVILQMKALRLGEPESFPFIDRPEGRLIRDGYQTLVELGAVDDKGQLTGIGRSLARLPIDPRLGRMILAAAVEGALAEVLIITAALAVQDPRERPLDQQQAADQAHAAFAVEGSDFLTFLGLWRAFHGQLRRASRSQARKWCHQHFLSYNRMREWLDIHQQLLVLARELGLGPPRGQAAPEAVHRALLTGLLSNIGLKGDGYEYAGAHALKFHLHPGSGLFDQKPRWVMAAELVETTRVFARTVAGIEPRWLEALAPHLIQKTWSDPRWDREHARVVATERVTLFGLPVVAGRRVHYGPISPAGAREIFIHRALVEHEYDTRAPFFLHNQKLLEQVRLMEKKVRDTTLLVLAQQRYEFYDRRLPADVYSGESLEKWRHRAERADRRLLFMGLEDLVRPDAPPVTPQLYPDSKPVGGAALPLTYDLAPGAPTDGVTLTVPLAALNQVSPRECEWLIPGKLREKIIALIRALPKTVRTAFVPVPQYADAVLDALARQGAGKLSLTEFLTRELEKMTGVHVPAQAWQQAEIPHHLRMNFRLLDARERTLALGRDLPQLQAAHGPAASAAFIQAVDESRYRRDGLTDWCLGDLPEVVHIRRAGILMPGYPALVDQDTSVSLRLYDTPDMARQQHAAGVRRLFVLQFRRELRALEKSLPGLDETALLFAPLGPPAALRDDLLIAAVERAFLAGRPPIRTAMEFALRMRADWHKLQATAGELAELAGGILRAYQAVSRLLDGRIPPAWGPAVADVRQQLQQLLPPRFLTRTPPDWLPHLPRYLAGVRVRLEKLGNAGLDRDRRCLQELAPWLALHRQAADRNAAINVHDPALERFGWLLEEMRISLFAQELHTALPVSWKRLEKQWAAVKG